MSLNMRQLLSDYLKKWNCSKAVLIEETPTSHVYKVKYRNQFAVLKIYTVVGRKFESQGPFWLKACSGSAVIDVYKHDEGACLLEYIDGEELIQLTKIGRDEEATLIIAKTLNSIHKSPIPKEHKFKTFEEQFSALIDHKNDAPNIIHRVAKFAKRKLNKSYKPYLLHGDMHHKNIMNHSTKGWLAFDPQCLVGDRSYDCANTLHNPHQMPELTENKDRLLKQVEILSSHMDINSQDIIDYAYIHGCLSSCWTKMDEGHYCQLSLNTSMILEEFINQEVKK